MRLAATFLAVLAAGIAVAACSDDSGASGEAKTSTAPKARAAALDTAKLPLGDKKYLSRAKRGYVFSCQRFGQEGGAGQDGPWIGSQTWNLKQKLSVQGSVRHSGRFSKSSSGSTLKLSGNGLPSHTTGVFPIQSSDPAYRYDRNPNSIKSYTLGASLPRNPKRGSKATCVGGTVGVMETGVPLFSAFDAGGRDAAAHEVQDRCEGHPQVQGQYHYHSLSSCLSDSRSNKKHSKLIGWALDGFGIYGQRGEGGEQLRTSKLDACHGHTHTITWNGKRRKLFHYHATLDFPYVVSCYRGTPITSAEGLGVGGPGGQGGAPPGGAPPGAPPPP